MKAQNYNFMNVDCHRHMIQANFNLDIQISNENEALVKIGTSMHRRANRDFLFRREEEIFYNCLVKGN